MNKSIVKRNTIIQILIISIALFLMIRIWPAGRIYRYSESNQHAIADILQIDGDSFGHYDKKLQTVIFTQSHINRIKMYVNCENSSDKDIILFRLYNDKFSCIYERQYSCESIEKNKYLVAHPDMDVVIGQPYYYEILVPEKNQSTIYLPVAPNTDLAQPENGILYIDGIINMEQSLVSDFEYSSPLSVLRIIGYDVIIILFSIVLYFLMLIVLDIYDQYENKEKIVRSIKIASSFVFVVLAIIGLYLTTIRNVFASEIADRVCYALGIIVAFGLLIYSVWIDESGLKKLKTLDEEQVRRYKSLLWRDFIQMLCFALAVYSLCNYVNADREYIHTVNTRWMLIFLGIAFLMIQNEKQFLNVFSYIWLGLSVLGSFIYCNSFQEEEELYIAKLSAAVVVVWGLTIINSLMQIRVQCFKRIDIIYFGLWLVFGALTYYYRFEKTWPITATLPFLAIILYNLKVNGKARLLNNFANGVLLSFGFVIVFSLLHRPYHFWIFYRYPMMFHTVAYTGLYLSLVFAVAIGQLYIKWKNETYLFKNAYRQLLVVAVSIDFVVLCMARTALMSVAVNLVVIFIMVIIVNRKSLMRLLKESAVMLVMVIACFPLVFSLVRIVPSLYRQPVSFSVEPQAESYSIREYDRYDSSKYMTIRRYFDLFLFRLDIGSSEKASNDLAISNEILVASADDQGLVNSNGQEEDRSYTLEKNEDKTNGRLDIYRAYLQNLTLKGHEEMAADGTDLAHAHNSYIQVAHDFGIIAGVLFLIICGYTFVKSIMLYYRYGKKYSIYIIPLSVITSFGVVSITEWVYHPCIPMGFCFILMSAIMLQKTE